MPRRPGLILLALALAVAAAAGRGTTAAASEDGVWEALPSLGRWGHSAFYDPVRHRMLVYGGEAGYSPPLRGVLAFSLVGAPRWTHIPVRGMALSEHPSVYDHKQDRLLRFAGNVVWELSLRGVPEWSQLTATGTPPPSGAPAAYDPVRQRVLVVHESGVWALRLKGALEWTTLAVAGTLPGAPTAAHYDPVRDRIVTSTEHQPTGGLDVWALALGATPSWSRILLASPIMWDGPVNEIYDYARDRLVFFDDGPGHVRGLPLTGAGEWTHLWNGYDSEGPRPHSRDRLTVIYDATQDRAVLYGGDMGGASDPTSDVWAFSLSGAPEWTKLLPATIRRGHTAVFDPPRQRMLVWGGDSREGFLNDVFAVWTAGPLRWTWLSAPAPGQLPGDNAIYDPVRDRILAFSGGSVVWALTPDDQWTPMVPGGVPPPAGLSGAVHDPVRDRVLALGSSAGASEVWGLSLTEPLEWIRLSPGGAPPPPRYGHVAAYDPVRDRMLILGGFHRHEPDVWALSLSGTPEWAEIIPEGTPPEHGHDWVGFYDPRRDRIVTYGGGCAAGATGASALSLSGTPTWSTLERPGAHPRPTRRERHSGVYDPVQDRLIVFGGYNYEYLDDLWALRFPTTVDVAPEPSRVAARLLAYPNPARGEATIQFSLPESAEVVVQIFDTSGRMTRELIRTSLASGAHTLRWDGRRDSGARTPSGIYFCELRAGALRSTKRLLMLP